MKILKRILIVMVILGIIVFAAGTVYVKYYGKALLEAALNRSLDKSVTLGEASYVFPFGLKARDIRITDPGDGGKLFEAKDITAQLSPESVVRQKLIFDSVVLVKPTVVIENGIKAAGEQPERRYGLNVPAEPAGGAAADQGQTTAQAQGAAPLSKTELIIKNAVLKEGHFEYSNRTDDNDFSFGVEDVYVSARNLIFPVEAGRTDFKVTGRLVKEGNPLSGSTVEGSGWVDLAGRNMDARVEIVEEDGTVGLTANAVAKNNDMDVSGEVQFKNIFSGVSGQVKSDSPTVDNLIFDALSSAGVEVAAKYSFKAKMDDFRPEQVSFSGNVVTK